MAAGKSVCSFFTACYYAADLERADAWVDLLRRQGLLGGGFEGAFLHSHCETLRATLLCELGRWGEAEAVLSRSITDYEAAVPVSSWHPAIALADLRIRQRRLSEAEGLLLGKDQAFEALLPAARLHLARGDHDLARAAAARGLRALRGDRLRALQLLAVSIDAELAWGDVEAAAAACDDLVARTAGLDVPALAAKTAALRARVLAASGRAGEAVELLEPVVDGLDARRLPWLRATLLLDLAALRERARDRSGAVVDATAAAATLARGSRPIPGWWHGRAGGSAGNRVAAWTPTGSGPTASRSCARSSRRPRPT